jgi:trimeric autotransporter adhesin
VGGISSGTVIISYTLGSSGCMAIVPVIVNPSFPIVGTPVVCSGQTTHLSDTALGGIWSSSATSVATVDVAGTVTGIGAGGLATISYLRLGCTSSVVVTVNPSPSGIAGILTACVGQTSNLLSLPAGGSWASSLPAIGSISVAGTVTAVSPGTTTITYTLPVTGCYTAAVFTVNGLPAAISGPGVVCSLSTMTLTASSGGAWASSAPSIASVGSATGVVSGISLGMATITYTTGSGCNSTKTITVISTPSAITGPDSVCQFAVIALSNSSPGGTWSSSSSAVASVDAFGYVTGGTPATASIVYSLGPGCDSPPFIVTVNALPLPITPSSATLCPGDTLRLHDASGTGTWSSTVPSIASIDPAGLVTGLASGSAVISYTFAHGGCARSIVANVNAGPAPITGLPIVCVGAISNLSDATPGGTWSSSNPAAGTVDPVTGAVTGIAPGTTLITYTVSGLLCPSALMVAVNPPPVAIAGSPDICQGETATLTDATGGGIWSSSAPATVAIGSSTGIVTAASTGVPGPVPVIITYSTGPAGTGCDATFVINANPLPAPISGPNSVCSGQSIILSDATPGGTWSSSAVAIGTVSTTGIVTGVSGGTIAISYANSYGCAAIYSVTVNTSPTPITGSANICLGGTSVLSSTPAGGTWRSFNIAIASVGASSGIVTGNTLGSTIIEYTVAGSCRTNITVYVQPLPLVYTVTGGGNHCAGDPGVHIYLSNSTVGVNYMLYNGTSAVGAYAGTGAPLDFGLHAAAGAYTVIATTTATGCSRNMLGSATVGIIPSVTPSVTLGVSPNDTVCAGATATFTPIPVNGGTAPTYTWYVNSTPVAIAGSYAFIPADHDTVMVVMTSNAVCPSPAAVRGSMVMTVLPFGTPNVGITALPNDTVCRGDVVTVVTGTDFAGTAPVYTWVKNTYIMPGETGPTYSFVPNDGDFVWCKLASNYPCRLASTDTSNTITITTEDPVMPVVTIAGNYLIDRGGYDTLTASVAGAVYPTYQWYINGIPVTGATNAIFIHNNFSYPQIDSVSCMVTNHGVCTVTGHQWILIQSTTVGVRNITTEGNISVVPNPNKGVFMIRGSLGTATDEAVTIEITDMIGQSIYGNKVTAKNGVLNESVTLGKGLANGMYLLTIRSESESRVFYIVVEQ